MKHYICWSVVLASFVLLITPLACGGGGPKITSVESMVVGNSAIITWDTNTDATSQVEYGLTDDYGTTTDIVATPVKSHTVTLDSLCALSTYHFRVCSQDASGVESISQDYTFSIYGVEISAVTASSVTHNSAVITWTTDLPARSEVEYGTTADYGSTTVLDSPRTTSHSAWLTGLTPSTTYHFSVKSVSSTDVETVSADYTFGTLRESTLPYTANVSASNIGGNRATITWTTSVPATTEIEYGLTAAYSAYIEIDTVLSTIHSVTLTGLTRNTTYHYRVISTEGSGMECISGDRTFTTSSETVTLNAGITTFPSTNNPFNAVPGLTDSAHISIMYEPLVLLHMDGTVTPLLAQSWNYDDSGLTWTITLNPDARFSSGTQVTAADVKLSLETYIHNDLAVAEKLATALKQATAGETDDAAVLSLVRGNSGNDKIIRTAGSFITDGYVAGEMIYLSGTVDGPDKGITGDQDGTYMVTEVKTLELIVGDAGLINEGPDAGIDVESTGPAADAIIVVDDGTVVFALDEPIGAFPQLLADFVIVPYHIWGNIDMYDIQLYANVNPIGSGPFVVTEMVEGSHIIYEAHPDYWRGAPNIDVLVKTFYINEESQLLALKTGEIDTVADSTPILIPQLLVISNLEIYQVNENTTYTLYLNHRVEPFEIPEFRQALNIGIDRQQLIDFAANGWGTIPNLVEVSPHLDYAADGIEWPYAGNTHSERIDTANELLDTIPGTSTIDGGVDGIRTHNGEPLQFELLASTLTGHTAMAELIREDCLEMGIDVTIEILNATSLVTNVFKQYNPVPDWDAMIWGRPYAPYYDHFADQWDYTEGDWSSRGVIMGWSNEAIQDDLTALQFLPHGDPDRDDLIQSTQLEMAAELPCIPLYHSVSMGVYRTDKFSGWVEDSGLWMNGYIPSVISAENLLSVLPVEIILD
ncbi:ABC transporter substrate-binding protein [Chloroflexota bacterium]